MPHEEPLGRRLEMGRLDAFLDRASSSLAALSVTGPAGIGKTTIWRAGTDRASDRGFLVLSARPAEAEARFSFSGLGDALRSVGPAAFEPLPEVQRHVLDVALLRAGPTSRRVDGRKVSTALLTLLQHLASERPVMIAVDDAQWLDEATSETLSFAVRRLEGSPVGVLVSVRVDGDRADTFELAVAPHLRDDLALGPLGTAALHEVVKRQLGRPFPRPTLVQIVAASGGNPFYAVEIARELDRTGIIAPGTRLPLPAELRALSRGRVSRLPRRTRDALLVAASLTQPTVALVDAEALGPAEDAGIARVLDGGAIRFTHPLLASAVYESAPAARRQRVHRDLAERVADREERARHLGLAAPGPDEAVAKELDDAADGAVARGAMAAACDLCRQALELTEDPHGPTAIRRALVLARHLLDVGRTHEAKALMEGALADRPDDELLAQVLHRLGQMCWYERDFETGYAHLVEALRYARDPAQAARTHSLAAWISEPLDLDRAIRHVDSALELLDPEESPGPYGYALMYRAYLRLINGQGADQASIDRGLRMQRAAGMELDDRSPVAMIWPKLMDDFALSRRRYEAVIAQSTLLGEEPDLQALLPALSEIELWTGNWARADELASAALTLTDRIASPTYFGLALFARGSLDAHLGRMEEARAIGERILDFYAGDVEPQLLYGHWLLGFVALSLQDFTEADVQLSRASEIVGRMGQREPARYRFQPDHAEAVIATGDLDRAAALVERLEERAATLPRPWILSTAARCRGLLRAGRGDLDGAEAALREALGHHERLDMPFELARTLLAQGQVSRRRKARRAAAAALGEALEVFERLGARVWAERARAELTRIPAHRTPTELTPTEVAVAKLAATGLTNREIAERAFLSPKTVEVNLTRIYRKLGVPSRTALAAWLAAHPVDQI
jgi:DNA-binding CsgD family transcriptional regulator